jgi:hypothetical protein
MIKKMKNIFICICTLIAQIAHSQGNDCSNAIPFQFDGVCRSYNFTSTLDSSYFWCYYDGSVANVVWFSYTSDAQVSPVEIEFSVQGSPLECKVFNSPVCNGSSMLPYQNLCMDDGNGMWGQERTVGAPLQSIQPNTTYYFELRPISGFTGQLSVCARPGVNFNYRCNSALNIASGVIWDNNAYAPNDSAELIPQQVCATTLENTKWYKHTRTGNADNVFSFSAVDCDNFESGVNGYQVGMFTGACGALVYQGICFAAFGGAVNFPINQFPVGTDIWFALDGNYGANCKYMVGVFTAPLAIDSSKRIKLIRGKPLNFKIINPVRDQIRFYYYNNSSPTKLTITVINTLGQIILVKTLSVPNGNSINSFPIIKLPSGIYFVRFYLYDSVWTEKIFLVN